MGALLCSCDKAPEDFTMYLWMNLIWEGFWSYKFLAKYIGKYKAKNLGEDQDLTSFLPGSALTVCI